MQTILFGPGAAGAGEEPLKAIKEAMAAASPKKGDFLQRGSSLQDQQRQKETRIYIIVGFQTEIDRYLQNRFLPI
jgi:hypothetical protein